MHALFGQGYGSQFDAALLSHIKARDAIWDVGANVGLYTTKFLERTGPKGKVVAFEPVPECFDLLYQKFKGTPVVIEQIPLSSSDGTGRMRIVKDPLGSTHQLSESSVSDSEDTVPVNAVTADSYRERSGITPNVIKIDVEGFEGDVFKGMRKLLVDMNLRPVFCELHFALLENRGQEIAPLKIERLLRDARFDVKYEDSSHTQAHRRAW